jgi:beta-lactamase class A
MSGLDAVWARCLAGLDAAWEVRLGDALLAAHDAERIFSGASMVKTLLAAVVAGDHLALAQAVVDVSAAADGSGVLRFGEVPTTRSLGELLLLMVALSDNTATNAIIDLLGGVAAVNARFAERGWSARLHRYAGRFDAAGTPLAGLSITEHQAALALIGDRRPFLAQQDRSGLARWLHPEAPFAHKTGAFGPVRHDAGVLATARGELWVACFTDGGPAAEYLDHPAWVGMGAALRETLLLLELPELLAA